MRIFATLAIVLLLFNPGLTQENTEEPDPISTALDAVGLTKQSLAFDYGDMSNYGGDKFVLPLFYTMHSSPLKIEHYSKVFRDNILHNIRQTHVLTSFASRRINEGIRRGLISNPIDEILPRLESETPLKDAIVAFEALYTVPMDQNRRGELEEKAAEVPLELQKMAAVILYSCIDSLRYHRRAFQAARDRGFDLDDMREQLVAFIANETDHATFEMEPFLEAVDFKYLYTPAQDIAIGLDFAADSLRKLSFNQKFEFEWRTSAGIIMINDNRNHEYEDREYLLIIDAGGSDIYEGGGCNKSTRNWISILVDLYGDDIYKAADETLPSFGAGVFGYGYLVDLAGNDTYSAKNLSQGAGLCGVGILQDHQGSDFYDAYVCGQGSGFIGQGILADLDGDDSYQMFQLGQGFGYTKGIGILADSSGNDLYIANDSIIDFPSSQSEEHNASLCQGVGFGKRADFIDGHSWAGGIGMLVDGSGDDSYTAGLFAQGCAYWYAIGLLSDSQGKDTYDGIWYVQGSGAHFGLGILLESDGDDRYNATMNMAQGAGHDFTLGILIDENGDDIHDAPNLSLGGGNANGIGIFWDKQGNDIYNVTAATTLGRSNVAGRGGLRDYIKCLGLFLDTGGLDTYPEQYDFAGNNTLWTQPGTNTEDPLPEIELGVGFDTESKK